MATDPITNEESGEAMTNGSAPAPKKRTRRAQETAEAKKMRLQAELLELEAEEQAKADEERQARAKTPEGRMDNLEGAVGNIANALATIMHRLENPPDNKPTNPALEHGHLRIPTGVTEQPTDRRRHPIVPLTQAQFGERVQKWWSNAQPLLRQCWMYRLSGAVPEDSGVIIRALGELYENSFKNLHGEMPSTAGPQQYAPGWGD